MGATAIGVLLTLEEKGAPYEFAAMQPGSLKQEPHLSRDPFGRTPAFEHDGGMLYEASACATAPLPLIFAGASCVQPTSPPT
jgi:glutathione S-transferase